MKYPAEALEKLWRRSPSENNAPTPGKRSAAIVNLRDLYEALDYAQWAHKELQLNPNEREAGVNQQALDERSNQQ